jgi:hypothetical protein
LAIICRHALARRDAASVLEGFPNLVRHYRVKDEPNNANAGKSLRKLGRGSVRNHDYWSFLACIPAREDCFDPLCRGAGKIDNNDSRFSLGTCSNILGLDAWAQRFDVDAIVRQLSHLASP